MGYYAETPTIYQRAVTECGAASLCMIFLYYGKQIPLEKMCMETKVSEIGCNAGDIVRTAKRYGFESHGYRLELDELISLRPPCIIHWNFNHFVVFEGFVEGSVYLNDPAVGRRKITLEELDEGFTGITLTFQLTKEFDRTKQ